MISRQKSEYKLSNLKTSIEGIGKPDYPFNHKNYELNTAIPCTDFTKWIIDWYLEKDFWAIKLLKWEIEKSAKGLIFGAEDDPSLPKEKNSRFQSLCVYINHLLTYNLRDFFDGDDLSIAELFTLLLMDVSPLSSILEYLYPPNNFTFSAGSNTFIDAISCSTLKPKLGVINKYISNAEKLRSEYLEERGINYDHETHRLKEIKLDYKLIQNNNLYNILKDLPISHRLHFWDLINSSYMEEDIRVNRRENLDCWYRTTAYGFDPNESRRSLLVNGILEPLANPKIVLNKLMKNEVVQVAQKLKIDYKKSATKQDIIKNIITTSNVDSELLEIVKEKQLFSFAQSNENDLQNLIEYKNQISKVLEVLSLIELGKPSCPISFFYTDSSGTYIIYKDNNQKVPLEL